MAPTNQKLNAITSGLMGIFFGTAIVYVISRLIAVQRRLVTVEQRILELQKVDKAADETVVSPASS
jgi:biopolymer transport protein ExbB/TolQ